MMIHAYPEIYLSSAMRNMGDAFDYAINDCGMEGDRFVMIFTGSTVCRRFENGETRFLVGMSGIELAQMAIEEVTGKILTQNARELFNKTPEYWCGWSAAYYQWLSERKFQEIFQAVPFGKFLSLYPVLHEADVTKTAEVIDKRIKSTFSKTNLERICSNSGQSWEDLSAGTGIAVSVLEGYASGEQDINRAGAFSLYRIARALGCSMEDLIEHRSIEREA